MKRMGHHETPHDSDTIWAIVLCSVVPSVLRKNILTNGLDLNNWSGKTKYLVGYLSLRTSESVMKIISESLITPAL